MGSLVERFTAGITDLPVVGVVRHPLARCISVLRAGSLGFGASAALNLEVEGKDNFATYDTPAGIVSGLQHKHIAGDQLPGKGVAVILGVVSLCTIFLGGAISAGDIHISAPIRALTLDRHSTVRRSSKGEVTILIAAGSGGNASIFALNQFNRRSLGAISIDHDLIIADSQAKLVVLLSLGDGEASIGRSGSQLLRGDGGSGHGVLGYGSSRIGGTAAVDSHGGDGSGPDIRAHVTDLDSQVSFLDLVIGQMVQLTGLAGKSGQVQVAVLACYQRGEHVLHVIIAGQFQAQVAAADGIQGIVATALTGIDPEVPDITIVVQQDKMLGIMNDAILVFNLLSAEGGNTDQVAAHGAQIEANGIQGHGVLGGQQIGIVDGGNHFLLIGGEDFAVGHIPQRNVVDILCAG